MTIKEHSETSVGTEGAGRSQENTWSVADLAARVHILGGAVERIAAEVAAKRAGVSVAPAPGAQAEAGAAIPVAPSRVSGDPRLTPQATTVLEKRYMKKDTQGRLVERPAEMFRRVAQNLAQNERFYNPHADVDAWSTEFYHMMASLDFLPNSPALANAGRELQQLSACFVLPVEDALDRIFDSVKQAALIHKTGGGTGFSFGRLRPTNDIVASTGQVASGPVSFMRVFDAATEAIKQGGMRRGANMGILPVTHPDIMDFITCKADMVSITNFNISVTVTEEFMQAVERDGEYDLINPRTGQPSGRLRARAVFQKMVDNAWKNGDPGIVFIDRVNRDHPTPHISPVESTNPCGEQPLMPYESCNLGSLNLARMVRPTAGGSVSSGWGSNPQERVDWDKLGAVIRLAVRFLDNVIDMNHYIVPEIEVVTRATRKIGLGVMGWADMLLQFGIPYNSEAALRLGERVMEYINQKANEASLELGRERGAFPSWEHSIYDYPGGPRYRNSTRTTIAPTGTISLIAGASSGIEPIFALCFQHHGLEGAIKERFVNPIFEQVAKERGFYIDDVMDAVAAHGSCHGVAGIPEDVQRVFVTAHDVDPLYHVRMQAAFQRHTDNAVSKTINFPASATEDDVANAYKLAYREGCKGITIYRDSSRAGQVLTAGSGSGSQAPAETETRLVESSQRALVHWEDAVAPRPDVLNSKTIKQASPFGNLYVTVSEWEAGDPFEVFATIGKAGSDVQAMTEAACRAISQMLRLSSPLSRRERLMLMIEQFEGIGGYATTGFGSARVRSIPDAIAKALRRYLGENFSELEVAVHDKTMPLRRSSGQAALGDLLKPDRAYVPHLGAICSDCGQASVYMAEGCMTCQECGWSQC
ncbi:MAG: vitamin B12-dependent ribonucleotide reductase [Dehalococcoidia bacterium]|nr:vitamin B12-dependent ribonucleotide reductase [Dehalococcoidia bacterium]